MFEDIVYAPAVSRIDRLVVAATGAIILKEDVVIAGAYILLITVVPACHVGA
jgi:hypothetical protein